MRTVLIVTSLLFLGSSAMAGNQTDNNVWVAATKHTQGRSALHDAQYCTHLTGPDLSGEPTPRAKIRCMASRGWRLARIERNWSPGHYLAPDDFGPPAWTRE
ncbi:MAG: hypothetical protein JWO28_2058 [Hyphomicrobiales bacterium]|jgi:hypothetical protein|nr:hypothetical protein [Hyphomicrobiales bacterium]